jgi:apurinic endonuclease APN1
MEQTSISYLNPNIKIGFHIGGDSTLVKTFENVLDMPLRSYQIYISSEKYYIPPRADPLDVRMTYSLLKRNNKYACIHGSLFYNLAGSTNGKSDPQFQRKLNSTCEGLTSELDISAGFESGVVVHVGTCKDKKKGIFTIAKAIENCLTRQNSQTIALSKELQIPIDTLKKSRKIILENAAGEKNKIGSNLDEIAEIINLVDKDVRDQIMVCIDTAHIFGAGQYDFGKPKCVKKFYEDFDEKIGLDRLELFHLNDSRVEYGSKKDRHENLGLGYMFDTERENGYGIPGLQKFIEKAEEYQIPLIGEPPAHTKEGYSAPGGLWDYMLLKEICPLEEEFFC